MDFHLERISVGRFRFIVDREPQQFGFCRCGCGLKTDIATYNVPGKTIKGQPLRYRSGHGAMAKKTEKEVVLKGTCLVWMGVRSSEGYAIVGHVYIHTLLYEKLTGRIPDGLELDHLCRNRFCINPRHVEPVSRAENCRRGDGTKLTYSDVAQIKSMRERGVTLKTIAKIFSVGHPHVSRICSGKVWK